MLVGLVLSFRSRLWGVLPVLLSLALLIGFKTPLFDLVFHLPGWNVLSNVERLSFVMTLPLAVLAGIGTDWLLRLSRRDLAYPAAIALVIGGILAWQLRMDDVGYGSAAVCVVGVLVAVALALAWRLGGAEAARARAAVVIPVGLTIVTLAGALADRALGWGPGPDQAPPPIRKWLPLVAANDDPDGRWMSYCQRFRVPYPYHPEDFLEVPGRWLDLYESFIDRGYHDYWRALIYYWRAPTNPRRVTNEASTGEWYQHTPNEPNTPNRRLVDAAGITRILARDTGECNPPGYWKPMARNGDQHVLANTSAFPMAFVSRDWEELRGGTDPAIERIAKTGRPFARHVDYVDADIPPPAEARPPIPARVERDGADEVTVDFSRVSAPALVVLLDSYHPDWNAYTQDGDRLSTVRVNGVFRGVEVEPGDTQVTFRYQPWWRVILPVLSWLTVIALLLTLGLAAWRRRREPVAPAR
jgi:hypothetical protein